MEKAKNMEPGGGQSETPVTGRASEWAKKNAEKLLLKSLQVSAQEPADLPGSGGKRVWGFGKLLATYGTVASNSESTAYLSFTVKKVLDTPVYAPDCIVGKKDS